MNKIITLLSIFSFCSGFCQNQVITKQGQITFFSYTSVENIEAENNQVLSIIDLSKKEIAIQMLMRAFVFKKALMEEHFNESYIESDIYPKAVFEGEIIDFDPTVETVQTKIVKGTFTLHGVTKNIEVKTEIAKADNTYMLSGEFEAGVKDYEIKVPPLLKPNIAKTIKIMFKFEYQPYEKK